MQYLRYCQVSGGNDSFTYDASTDEEGLRIRFEIHAKLLATPGIALITVVNPTREHALQYVQKQFQTITVDAGYIDGHGVIFRGNLIQGIYGRESPTDTHLIIFAADGDHGHNSATVSTTFPPGSTPQQHVDTALQAMAPFGITKGYIGVDLTKPVYSRAVTLFGMARDVFSNIAKSKNATVSYQQQQLTMVPQGQNIPGNPVVLNSLTGLVGMPTQTTEGIFARCLINPSIKVHTQIHIDQALIQGGLKNLIGPTGEIDPVNAPAPIAADGIYTVYRIDGNGDTRGNPWYMDLMCFAPNIPPKEQPGALITAINASGFAPQLGHE